MYIDAKTKCAAMEIKTRNRAAEKRIKLTTTLGGEVKYFLIMSTQKLEGSAISFW